MLAVKVFRQRIFEMIDMTGTLPKTGLTQKSALMKKLLMCTQVAFAQIVSTEFTLVAAGAVPPTIQPSEANRGVRVRSYSCATADEESCSSGPFLNDEVEYFKEWANTVVSSAGYAFGEASQNTTIDNHSINGTGHAWTSLGPAYEGNTSALSDLNVHFTVPEDTAFVFRGTFKIESTGDPGFAQGFYSIGGSQPDGFIYEFVGVDSPAEELEFEIQGIAPADTLIALGIGVNTEREILQNNNPPLQQEGEIRLEFDFSLSLATNALVGFEVVQVVQDWENSIPLIAGKKTIVRAHIENPSASAEPIRPVLHGKRGDVAFGPLPASNPRAEITPPADSQEVRGKLHENAWFELPKDWYWEEGTPELEVKLEDEEDDLICSEVAGPMPDDCQVSVMLSEADPPDVALVGIRYRDRTDNDTIYDVSHSHLLRQLAHLESTLPVATDSITPNLSRIALSGRTNPDVGDILPFVRKKRGDDKCAAGCTTYYYGVLQYFNDLSGVADNIPGTHAVGYAPLDTKAEGRQTISHEIGHLLGREHTTNPTIGPGGQSGELGACCSWSDGSDFPLDLFQDISASDNVCNDPNEVVIAFSQGRRPLLGPMDDGDDVRVYGFDGDQDKVIDPEKIFDLMSYCSNPGIDMWPSRFTYQQFYTQFQSKSFAFLQGAVGDFYLVTGTVNYTDDSVNLAPVHFMQAIDSPTGSPPGSYTLRWLDAAANELGSTTFEPSHWRNMRGNRADSGSFAIYIPVDPAIHSVVVEKNAMAVAALTASANPPTIEVLSPNSGEMLNAELVELTWVANDADGDPLFSTVQYSNDAGTSWQTIAIDQPDSALTIDRGSLPAGDTSLFRVRVNDGFRHAVDTSDAVFSVANNPPVVDLASPGEGRSYWDGQLVIFRGVAFDPEDGALEGMAFQWSSDIDGVLGSGEYLEVPAFNLTRGEHLLTVAVIDSGGAQAIATRSLMVGTEGSTVIFSDSFESGQSQ